MMANPLFLAAAFLPWESALLKLIPPLGRYVQIKNYRRESEECTKDLKSKLENLEDVILGVQSDVRRNADDDWHQEWRLLQKVKDDISIFHAQLDTSDLYRKRKQKEQVAYCKRKAETIDKVSQYVEPAEQALVKLRSTNKIDQEELGAVKNYLTTLKDAYERSKLKEINLEEGLKQFEHRYVASKVTEHSKKRRLETAAETPKKQLDLTAEAIGYVSGVYKKLSDNAPEYDPRGHYLDEKSKWKTKIKTGKTIRAQGVHKQWLGWTNDGLRVSCEYIGDSTPSAKTILKRADSAANRLNNRYEIVCLVGDEENKDYIENTIKQFSHKHLSIFYYSLENKELYYNKTDTKAEIFAPYFNGETPKNIYGILKPLENTNGVIEIGDIKSKFGFGGADFRKLERDVLDYAGITSYKLAK